MARLRLRKLRPALLLPRLAQPAGAFRDRFPGTVLSLPQAMRRDFAELTAANELDIAAVNPDLRQGRTRSAPPVHLMEEPAQRPRLACRPGDRGQSGDLHATVRADF